MFRREGAGDFAEPNHAYYPAPFADGILGRLRRDRRDRSGPQHLQPGYVIQSVPPSVSQKPELPPLNLTDDQRAKIKQVLSTKNTEVTFQRKTTKPAQSFNPAMGAKIPTGLKAHSLPPPLIYQMPTLKHYTYLKFKGQVLIVNPMTGKIVDMFSET